MTPQLRCAFVCLSLLAAACSGGVERPTLSENTIAADDGSPSVTVDVAGVTETRPEADTAVDSSAALASTIPISTTVPPSTTTSTEPDDGPPGAPTNVVCALGAATTDRVLSWDAADEDADVVAYRIYVADADGAFVQRANVNAVNDGSGRESSTVAPVPDGPEVLLAVTAFDGDGNESGWNPIGARSTSGGSTCAAPTQAAITSGVNLAYFATGELTATFTPPEGAATYLATVQQDGVSTNHSASNPRPGGTFELVFTPVSPSAEAVVTIIVVGNNGLQSDPVRVTCAAPGSGCAAS